MAGNSSSKFSKSHILTYTKPEENRLYVFDAARERFHCFPCFHKNQPLFFGHLKLLSVPSRGKVFVIGGEIVKQTVPFKFVKNKANEGKDTINELAPLDINPADNIEVSFLENQIESGLSLFAKAESWASHLASSNIVGHFELTEARAIRLTLQVDKGEQLELPRTNHLLVYSDPWIYVLGGREDGEASGSCRKYHLDDNFFLDICSLDPTTVLRQPGAIAVGQTIYLFDAQSETQTIYKYSMIFDVWEQISFKTSGFSIPPSKGLSVFQSQSNTLLILNGNCEKDGQQMNYYLFSLEEDTFTQERSDRKLINFNEDCQGNRDYSKVKQLYTQLNDQQVKVFFKDTWYWETINALLLKVKKDKKLMPESNYLGCCSKRK